MYTHVGNRTIVRDSELLGIFDLDGQVTEADTAALLSKMEKENNVEMADVMGLPKCFLLISSRKRGGERKEKAILSCISASSLAKRFQMGTF